MLLFPLLLLLLLMMMMMTTLTITIATLTVIILLQLCSNAAMCCLKLAKVRNLVVLHLLALAFIITAFAVHPSGVSLHSCRRHLPQQPKGNTLNLVHSHLQHRPP